MNLLELINKTKTIISDDSYKKYAKYYDLTEPTDNTFNDKLDIIYDLIINKKYDDIEIIAKESNCTLEECVMKIRYLKNKRLIGDYYIDINTKKIRQCSENDEKLLEEYSKFLYYQHLQIDEIALRYPATTFNNLEQIKEKIYNDIAYLYNKGLLNGIKLNNVDKSISYYTIDKRKNSLELKTINCPNCGAINELNKYSKVKCEYCGTIIEDNK